MELLLDLDRVLHQAGRAILYISTNLVTLANADRDDLGGRPPPPTLAASKQDRGFLLASVPPTLSLHGLAALPGLHNFT
jgi:hypothetical protein